MDFFDQLKKHVIGDNKELVKYHVEVTKILRSELATTRAENEKLRAALEPFARLADVNFCGVWEDHECVMHTDIAHKFTFGLIRAAKEALK